MERPNILLITTDTQRWDTLGCMGSLHGYSPGVDRLADGGVLFREGYTAAPVCMPARVSLMTGFHTPVHGALENGIKRRPDVQMLPDLLSTAGYHTIMVGKAHFGTIPEGFHVRHILKGEKGGNGNDFYAEHIRAHGYSRSSSHPNPIPPELFMDAFLTDTMIKEIDVAKKRDQPFFGFLSVPSPHSPNDPPGAWAHLYDDRELPLVNYREGETETHPEQLRRLVGTLDLAGEREKSQSNYSDGPFENVREAVGNHISRTNPDLIDQYRRLYYGLAAYCDAQVGRALDYLDAAGLRENTLVIFTSDHGIQLFDHGFNDKHTFYDASWHVPFVMSQPGTLPSGETREFAQWTDITATIAAAAGAAMPWAQGYDLYGPLSRGEVSPRSFSVATLYRSVALATREWKLVYYLDEDEGQLFNRIEDPQEQRNLYGKSEHRPFRDELLVALLKWRSAITDTEYLARNSVGGGPVANRIVPYTKSMLGRTPDDQLGERLEQILA